MKRYMRLLCAIAVAAMVASGVCAANFKVDGICYDKNADGRSVTVTFENKKPVLVGPFLGRAGELLYFCGNKA